MGTCLGPISPCAAKIRDMPRSDAVWGPGDHEYSRRIPGRPLDDKSTGSREPSLGQIHTPCSDRHRIGRKSRR